MTGWRAWAPDLAVGAVVLLVGLIEVLGATSYYGDQPDPRPSLAFVVVGIAAAAGLSRRLPAVALAVVWAVCAIQVVTGTQLLVVELAIGVVAFGCARWGSVATVWLSVLSIPLAAAIAVAWIDSGVFITAVDDAGFGLLVERALYAGVRWQITAAVSGTAVLGVPWLAGLALRFSAGAARSRDSQVVAEAARDQAEEIARLREDQARLARDVHDVVGHSLAVILAQAESAQYLDATDSKGLQRTMQNIATSARTSLDDVRQVLSSTSAAPAPRTRSADLDSLVEGVRASGHEVVVTEVGAAQPMPPELEAVAFRVLQEMLTNAIRHGRRDRPILVERHWEGDLRLEVRNAVGGPDDTPPADETQPIATQPPPDAGGQGIEGMRRRLESVGGHLDVRRRDDPPTFTATAWVPTEAAPMTISVLLVDDQDLFREGVRVIVDAQEGMEVVGSVSDGAAAVRAVDEVQPDVVLMDIRMPEMDGVEATRQLFLPDRAGRRERPVRVIVLTTFNLDDRAATAIRYGASGFLLKGTTPAMLADAIRTVHAGNAVLAPTDLTTLLDHQFRAATPPPTAYLELTAKEREVFAAVARGRSNAEIAGEVFLSESTVKTHVGAVLRKLSLRDRVQIVVFAHEHGLV